MVDATNPLIFLRPLRVRERGLLGEIYELYQRVIIRFTCSYIWIDCFMNLTPPISMLSLYRYGCIGVFKMSRCKKRERLIELLDQY